MGYSSNIGKGWDREYFRGHGASDRLLLGSIDNFDPIDLVVEEEGQEVVIDEAPEVIIIFLLP